MGFPKNNHYSRAFSVAIQKGVTNGTMIRLESEFNISSDSFPCHETTDTSTNSVLIDMVTGVFVFSLAMIFIGTVQGILGEALSVCHMCMHCEYGVATISRLLEMVGLFCKRAL